jgi:hypothetical protein
MKYQIIGAVISVAFISFLAIFVCKISPLKQNTISENNSTVWEKLRVPPSGDYRTKTPDGWLVIRSNNMVYVPDSDHVWLKD